MRFLSFGFCAAFLLLGLGAALAEPVRVRVDLTEQVMDVDFGEGIHETWTISSGRRGEETPTGAFRGYRWSRDHVSSIYGRAMVRAVFFHRGYAIHAYTGRLGRPVSHGCVRIAFQHADRLFNETRRRGLDVEIVGEAFSSTREGRSAERVQSRVNLSRSSRREGVSRGNWREPDEDFVPRSMR